ncbi:MAG: hypothetical protein ACK47B_04815 [Armatimonadota bacterium]
MERWELRRGEEALGVISLTSLDQPWLNGEFIPTASFEQVGLIFEEELRLLNEDQLEEWEKCYDRIDALGLSLHSLSSGRVVREFVLHIDGKDACFRY